MRYLKRLESTSKTIRYGEYRELYKDYFSDMLSSRTGFNNNSILNNLAEILGNFTDSYDDFWYDVDYLEKVKQQFKETKEDFDELSEILRDLGEEYNLESVIYTIKPYGKYKQKISHGHDSLPAFKTHPSVIKTNLETEDAIFDVYIGFSNEMESTGLHQMIHSNIMKGITDFIKILESKGSKVEMILVSHAPSTRSGDELRYKSFINLKFNYKY